MTYVSSYYHAFINADVENPRLTKAAKLNNENEQLVQKYIKDANDLIDWISKSVVWMDKRVTENTLSGTQKKLEEFKQYRRLQKPSRVEQRTRLESCFNNLKSNSLVDKLIEDKSPTEIGRLWKSLEVAERGFEEWLLSEMVKKEGSDALLQRLKSKIEANEERERKALKDGKPPISKRREELTKAINEARKKLENIGWKGSALNSSKSVANLKDIDYTADHEEPSCNHNNSDEIRRSISLSDLSVTPHRRVLPMRRMNHENESAPLWNRAKMERDRMSSQGMIRKSVSNVALNKSDTTPHNKTMPRFKSQGLWNSASAAQPSLRNHSGRLSAPLQRHYNKRNSVDNDLSDENSSSSSENYSRNLRPGTPPKPNILRQIRRSSTSQTVANNDFTNGVQPKPSRKLWDKFALRSVKSEYNLNFAGRDAPQSRQNVSNPLWSETEAIFNDKFDFAATNPATVPLTHELCHHVVDELNQIATFTKKIYHRSAAEGNTMLCKILVDGISKAYVSLSTVISPSTMNGSLAANVNEPKNADNVAQTMKLLQQYSDRLLNLVEQRMTKDNQNQN
ncbi:alpha-actinin-like protein [Leptotrombidium deliense]|uniref:Alpha-actinin-like protein n=1 Tax=Leptotrombidium deliense TaxID=299467 RepID=A0A443SIR9_9ACAR|nr:alpha-actinin-like protein [Leptotrombidium deliense]